MPEFPKPKSGGKPKKITTENAPGGSQTPGAKLKRMRDAQTTDGNNKGR